jgi:hypothetical protein
MPTTPEMYDQPLLPRIEESGGGTRQKQKTRTADYRDDSTKPKSPSTVPSMWDPKANESLLNALG